MSEVTGIIAAIKMSPAAKTKFYTEKGKDILNEFLLLQQSYETAIAKSNEMQLIYNRQESENPMRIDEYMTAINAIDEKYNQDSPFDSGDMLQIRYDEETQQLFYFRMFIYNPMESMEASTATQTILKSVATYKDIVSEDFIFFSDCATNLLSSQFYKIWSVKQGETTELVLNAWNEQWNEPLNAANQLAKKYYFDIVDKYSVYNESGYYETDNEGLDNALENNWVDQELLEIKN